MEYSIVWIEGFSPKKGEKITLMGSSDHTYTCTMADAMRVKDSDIEEVRDLLKAQGCAKWALDNAFVPCSYAPKGTIYGSKSFTQRVADYNREKSSQEEL